MRNQRQFNTQMREKLKNAGLEPKKAASNQCKQSYSINKHTQKGKEMDINLKDEHRLKDVKEGTSNIPQVASLAIASNLAESRVKRMCGKEYINREKGQEARIDTILFSAELLRIWNSITLPFSHSLSIYGTNDQKQICIAELLLLLNRLRNYHSHWSRMGNPFKIEDKPLLINFLEKLLTHAKTSNNAVFPYAILYIDEEKSTDKDGHEKIKKTAYLCPKWGSAFIVNLFLPRSQAERLIQKLHPQPFSRRAKTVLTTYCYKDSYSDTQTDPKAQLYREIIGYLSVPPAESKAGQEADKIWESERDAIYKKHNIKTGGLQQRGKALEEIASPLIRQQSKIRPYIHQALDIFNLLPELEFWGHIQNNISQPSSVEGDENSFYDEEMTEIWEDEVETIQQNLSPTKTKSASSSTNVSATNANQTPSEKGIIKKEYGRNNGLDASQRFIYDFSDGNIRFRLSDPAFIKPKKDEAGQPQQAETIDGVMRFRDFINLVYIALTAEGENKLDAKKITQAMFNWLKEYQASITQTGKNLTQSDFIKEHANYFPQQIQWELGLSEAPSLQQRIKKRIKARLERINELIDQDRYALEDKAYINKEGKSLTFTHKLSRHEQVHEILHFFIANLNDEGRQNVTRHEYAHLQKLLLQYKGSTPLKEIQELKNQNVQQVANNNTNSSQLSPKEHFWKYIHDHYTAELVRHGIVQKSRAQQAAEQGFESQQKPKGNVTEGKLHVILDFYTSESKKTEGKEPFKNVTSLGLLCSKILHHQRKELEQMKGELEGEVKTGRLSDMASLLQISQQGENAKEDSKKQDSKKEDTPPKRPTAGIEASLVDARCYSVIPAGFVQKSLGESWRLADADIRFIGNSEKQSIYTNMAQVIREHSTKMYLLTEYYDPKLVHPNLAAKIEKADGKLSVLNAESLNNSALPEKKQWRQTTKTLNDWYTHDKLCLLIAEKLANGNGILVNQGVSVDEVAQAPKDPVSYKGKGPKGDERTVKVNFSCTHQGTRGWMWSDEKTRRMLCLLHPNNETVEANILPEMSSRYESHLQEVVESFLKFEKKFYENMPQKADKLRQEQTKNGENYIPFVALINHGINLNIKDGGQYKKALKELRNLALHNASLNDDFPLHLKDIILQGQAEVSIEDIGRELMEFCRNHEIPREKSND